MKKVCMSLFFLLFSGTMVAQDGLFMGLGVGAAFPLGENQQAGVLLNPISVSLQLAGEGSFLGLTAGFLVATKSQYPVHYQRDTGEKNTSMTIRKERSPPLLSMSILPLRKIASQAYLSFWNTRILFGRMSSITLGAWFP